MKQIGESVAEIGGRIQWTTTPPQGVVYSTHKFSFADAIEAASNLLRTQYVTEEERLIVGREARALIVTLPWFISREPAKDGELVYLGELSRRKVFLDEKLSGDGAKLVNGAKSVAINFVE